MTLKGNEMTMRSMMLAASAALLMTAGTASAQMSHDHAMKSDSPAAQEYRAAMDRMHEAMGGVEDSGDADVDFARGMIPHHQAAIDMARTVLEYGKDPEIRKLAQDIVAAQEREIAQLEAWLKAHPAP